MKKIFKGTNSIVFLALLILSSCAYHGSRIACPSFDTHKVKKGNVVNKGIHLPKMSKAFSLKKNQKTKKNRILKPFERVKPIPDSYGICLNSLALPEFENSLILVSTPSLNVLEPNQKKESDLKPATNLKARKPNADTTINLNSIKTSNHELNRTSVFSKKKSAADIQQKPERQTARIIGGALLLMAVLAGLSVSALGTLPASIGLVGVFLLDILVSFCIFKYYKKEKPKLAKSTSFLRLLYTGILGIAIGNLFAGNVPMFNTIWGIGLIAFGIHLITLGILFDNEGGKKWVNVMIKSLLILAGIGYLIQHVGILVVPNPISFAALMETIFILPMILGEVFFALWMLIKGGRARS